MKISNDFFLKNRLTVMRLARDLLITEPEEQLQTINYYVDTFAVSRGTVQAAMLFLTEQGCLSTQFKGQLGTYMLEKDQEKLWEYSGFGTLNGAMSLPLNGLVAGLATGICECMKIKDIPFNCVFVQGSRTRISGLDRSKYDFVVASKLTESVLMADYPSLWKVMDLPSCFYSGEYVLLFSTPGKTGIADNMSVAVDPTSVDQLYLTKCVCEGKKGIRFNNMTYINTRESVINGKADVTVARLDTIEQQYLHLCAKIDLPQFPSAKAALFSTSVILSHRDNYAIDRILRHVLQPKLIASIQRQVTDQQIPPSYY